MIEETRLVIRSFQVQDQENVKSLILSGLAEHFDHFDPSLNLDLVNIEGAYLKAGHKFLVAEIKQRIVAAGALLVESREQGRIVRLSVHPDHRHQGIGAQMVDELIGFGREAGLIQINVETNEEWEAARALYEKAGFLKSEISSGSVYYSLMPNS